MARHRVTCIPGDGIGPEIMAATKIVLAATGVDIEWVDVEAGRDVMDKYGTPLPQSSSTRYATPAWPSKVR